MRPERNNIKREMKNKNLLEQLVKDLGLDLFYVRGQARTVKNCWHISTDGNAVDVMFYDEGDFLDGHSCSFYPLRGF